MATGVSGRKILFMPKTLGTPAPPTVLPAPSAVPGPASSFDLDDNQKRWVVIGICLNRLLLPVLRDFVGQEIPKHFVALKGTHGIDTQVFPHHLPKDGPFQLNYGSINNNCGMFKRKVRSYDYKVKTAEDLAKLYLEPHMAKFTGFDNTCDLSAVLGILSNASVFHARIQTNAKDVRSKVRNEWGHCNFDHWTDLEFTNCFQLMETMVRSVGLPKADEDKQLDDLQDWETKGLQLCMGCPVDKDLMKLISVEVTNLEKEVENIKQASTDEAKKISNALQTIRDEIDEYDKRITDIENRLEAERKERLEKQEALSGAIGDIANDFSIVKKRQNVDEENISLLEERQSDLEVTVSSLKDEQASLTSGVEALTFEQTRLDSRVKALEEGSLNAAANAKIYQVPSRNPCFCGRNSELDAIAAQLKNTDKGCVHSAICGLGGVGKTSLAVEFLWRHEGKYPGGIFWISGENNNLFQRSLGEMARQIGTFEKDFCNSLSRTLDWLRRRDELWCLVVDNLDELEMSTDMQKLLTGHWKYAARGHIIITTRREVREIGEETGIEEQCCIELKCLTEDEGIEFLRMRTGKALGEESDVRELVRELGGLPLALDQAGAYIRGLNQSIKEYLKKYKKQKLLLLKKKKARNLVENTALERLAVHTTWVLNFYHISRVSEELELGAAPTLVMQVCAFLAPDDLPYELINEELNKEGSSTEDGGLWDQAEIVALLTKFSLFQRYGTNSFSVHRLVQEVIRGQLENEQSELNVLSCAVRVLHHALTNTRSPAEVCENFAGDAVFSVENPPSLHLWGRLASHATFLQEHLLGFSAKHTESSHTLLYTAEVMRVFNEAGTFFSVSQEKVKAQEMQQLKLDVLVNLQQSTLEDNSEMPHYFVDIPLKERDYKLISHCMRQPPAECDALDEADTSQREREDESNQLREKGNLAVKERKFKEALELYSSAIGLSANDFRLYSNRGLCYLKLGQPQQALEDCEKCLSLKPNYSKALQRKAWALQQLVESGSTHLTGQKRAALAVAVHLEPSLCQEKMFREIFPELDAQYRIIDNETQLTFALVASQGTMLLNEGVFSLKRFLAFTDLQIVGLGKGAVLTCTEGCLVYGAKCYFENIVFPKGNIDLVCQGEKAAIHMSHCEISGGSTSCEDFPECNGGPGCIAASLGKPVCDRTGKFGEPIVSGFGGSPGVHIAKGSFGLIEDCVIHDCGGGGALVTEEGSRLVIRKCEVYKNHQSGLEAREGGELVASENRVFNNGYHGVLFGPHAGECDINHNKIFENAREGILAWKNKNKIVICNNDVHHNRPFGLSLDENSRLLISNNKIFENGFWGIYAKTRTSAKIVGNVISGNKCGGIRIAINYSGRIYLESNIVRNHSGPWLDYVKFTKSIPVDERLLSADILMGPVNLPQGKKAEIYSRPPILSKNKTFNNEEGICHPKEVVQRVYSGCTFCRRSRDEDRRLMKCPSCHIASYCCEECRRKHWPTHKTLCTALRRRYSVSVKITPRVHDSLFDTLLKGLGKGLKNKRNSRQRFIVQIRTCQLNSHPLQLLGVHDQSFIVDCKIQSPEIFSVIMECGVLGDIEKGTSKRAFFWAMIVKGGEELTIFLDNLAPYQEW